MSVGECGQAVAVHGGRGVRDPKAMARIALSCATGMALLRLLDSPLLSLPAGRALSVSLGFLCVISSLLVVRDGRDGFKKKAGKAPGHAAGARAAAPSQQAVNLEEENNVRWSFVPSAGTLCANLPNATVSENEACRMKVVVMHRPTHDPARDKSGEYPYSWHLHGHKRLWEVRVQLRFKKVPTSKMFFGLEMIPGPQTQTMITKRVQGMILTGIRGAIGKDFYNTSGDDPGKVQPGEECEPPAFAMPFWALDQFVESEIGAEPDLAGDLRKAGHRRTDGVKAYKEAMQRMLDTLTDQKYYTLCFWGVSQFVDVNKWEFRMPGVSLDANKLCGRPPLFVVAYDLKDGDTADPKIPRKHYNSQKNYIFKVAVWSASKPPDATLLQELVGPGVTEGGQSPTSPCGGGAAPEPCCFAPAMFHRRDAWKWAEHMVAKAFGKPGDNAEREQTQTRRKRRPNIPRWCQVIFGSCLGAPNAGGGR